MAIINVSNISMPTWMFLRGCQQRYVMSWCAYFDGTPAREDKDSFFKVDPELQTPDSDLKFLYFLLI